MGEWAQEYLDSSEGRHSYNTYTEKKKSFKELFSAFLYLGARREKIFRLLWTDIVVEEEMIGKTVSKPLRKARYLLTT